MNPKLIKFAVSLQNSEKVEEKKTESKFLSRVIRELAFFYKPAKQPVSDDNQY